jgi:homoserine dehydrogenase
MKGIPINIKNTYAVGKDDPFRVRTKVSMMINIAIIGFGVVGSATYEVTVQNAKIIEERAGDTIKVKRIVDIRDFDDHPARHLLTKNIEDVVNDKEISMAVESIGGLRPAFDFTKALLMSGKSVITSNKELVAMHGLELAEIAKQNKVSYLFEASVGGGIPIIRPIKQCLAANNINEIVGILNGTTNYILTKMREEGIPFADALKDAQEKGYAELNPSADVDGYDTCRKLSILCWMAFGKLVEVEKFDRKGIGDITAEDIEKAKAAGSVIKLVGRAKLVDGEIRCSVAPETIPVGDPLAIAEGVYNTIIVRGDNIGEAMFYGPGAGGKATASAVMGDVIEIARKMVSSRRRA